MSNLPALLLQLEAAIRAVEPRVIESLAPGLSDAEIDAKQANCAFPLPDDLRALYRWHGAKDVGSQFLNGFWYFSPLRPSDEDSAWIRAEVREDCELQDKPIPADLEKTNFVYLFDDYAGSNLVAAFKNQRAACEIRHREKGGAEFSLLFRGVEPMVTTALDWWQSGVFVPDEDRRGAFLKVNREKYREIARRLNPACSYWWSDAF